MDGEQKLLATLILSAAVTITTCFVTYNLNRTSLIKAGYVEKFNKEGRHYVWEKAD